MLTVAREILAVIEAARQAAAEGSAQLASSTKGDAVRAELAVLFRRREAALAERRRGVSVSEVELACLEADIQALERGLVEYEFSQFLFAAVANGLGGLLSDVDKLAAGFDTPEIKALTTRN
jgi:hypothetical protein